MKKPLIEKATHSDEKATHTLREMVHFKIMVIV